MLAEKEELHHLPMELGSQDLKEIIEIASQITAQLDVENIIKNVVLSFIAKFQSATVTFLMPHDIDENLPTVYHFQGLKSQELRLNIPSIGSILSFLEQDEYNQITFSYFK